MKGGFWNGAAFNFLLMFRPTARRPAAATRSAPGPAKERGWSAMRAVISRAGHIKLLAEQAVASPSGRRIAARSARAWAADRIGKRDRLRLLGAAIYALGGARALRDTARIAALPGDDIGTIAEHELLSGFWLPDGNSGAGVAGRR